MRRLRQILIALVISALLGGIFVWWLLQADFFWSWGGRQLVAFAQDRVNGQVNVREVLGNHLTGFTFRGVAIQGPKGEVLQAERLELRLSIWSFFRLQPVIARLAVYGLHLTLEENQAGGWNTDNLLKPRPPPPFHTLDFPQILIQHGAIEVRRPGESQSYRDLDLNLTLTVLHPKRPQQAILVRRAALSALTPLGRFALSTRFTYTGERLNLLALNLETEHAPLLSLAGEVRLGEPLPYCNLMGELGPLPGGELHRLWPRWPAAWDLEGNFRLNGTPDLLQISWDGRWQQAGYQVTGQVRRRDGQWDHDLALQFSGLQPELLAVFRESWRPRLKDLEPLDLEIKLQGQGLAWPPSRLQAQVDSAPFRFRQTRVEQLHLSMACNDREQCFQGNIRGNFGQLSLQATSPLLTSQSGEFKVQTNDFKPGLTGLAALPESQLNGQVTGRFRLPGAMPAAPFWLQGDLSAQGRWAGQPLKELRGRLTVTGSQLELGRTQLRLGGLAAELQGKLDPKQVDLEGRGSLALDGSWTPLPSSLRGRLEGKGTLKGPWPAPQYRLQAQAQGLSWDGFTLAAATVTASGAGLPPLSGRVEVQGSNLKTPAGTFSQIAWNSQGEGGRWRLHCTASSPQGPQAELLGAVDLQSKPHLLTLEKCRGSFPNLKVENTSPVQVRFLPGWEVLPAAFRVNDGRITLQGRAGSGQLAGRLEAANLPGDLVCIRGIPCQGKIRGHLDLNGDPAHPVIQGALTLGPGQWGDFSFESFHSTLSYRDARVQVSGALTERPAGPRLTWEGRLPLQFSVIPFRWSWGNRDLDFQVQGDQANLKLLTGLIPEVQGAEGAVNLAARWQGNPQHPQVSGQMRWGAGFLQLRHTGAHFRLLPGQANLQGDKLVIPDITLQSGGTAHINGTITMAGFLPRQFDLRGRCEDFEGLRRGGAEARGSGTVTLTGTLSAPVLKGRLIITSATFRPTFFQPAIHGDIELVRQRPVKTNSTAALTDQAPGGNLAMEVAFESTGGAWLKDKRLKVELAGDVTARKQPGTPVYWGGLIRSVKGTYELQGRIFQIERSLIRLPGKPHGEVTLEGQAVHEMDDLTLIANVSGPAGKPQVRLESNPPLPPPDLLAYLLFGRPAANLSREEYSAMGQQALGVLGGITAKKLQELLGQDFPLVGNLNLKSKQTEGRQTVGIVKPLTKDLSVTFERQTSPLYRDDTNQVRIEYKVNKYISVESQMGRRNSGGDVFFNLDF